MAAGVRGRETLSLPLRVSASDRYAGTVVGVIEVEVVVAVVVAVGVGRECLGLAAVVAAGGGTARVSETVATGQSQ